MCPERKNYSFRYLITYCLCVCVHLVEHIVIPLFDMHVVCLNCRVTLHFHDMYPVRMVLSRFKQFIATITHVWRCDFGDSQHLTHILNLNNCKRQHWMRQWMEGVGK